MSDDVETNREDDEKWILIDEKECRTCKKWNIPKILYCGHVIWICEKCLSEKYEENSDQICCPQCQGHLVDPLLLSNGGGKILQENLFTDLFQEEEFYNGFIFPENTRWCSSLHPENIPSVSFCRLCIAMRYKKCSDNHFPFPLEEYRESIKTCSGKQTSSPCFKHGTDSTYFCSTHNVPICSPCKDENVHKKCIVKDILEVRDERMQKLLSNYSSLHRTESIFIKEQQSAEKRYQEYKNRIHDEFEKLVTCIRDRQKKLKRSLKEKYTKKKEDLDRKLRRVIEHKSLMKRAMTSAPTPAFFDMTRTLQVICNNVVLDTSDDVTLELCQDDIRSVIEAIKRLGKIIEKDVLHFDDITCVGNFKLSENNKRAQKYQNCEDGIILSSQPMEYDKLYQVSVLACGDNQQGSMVIGVCWKDAQQALQSTAVIGQNGVWVEGVKVKKSGAYGKKLGDVGKGSIVGIAIRSVDCRLQLHLFIDGKDCGPSPVIFHKEPNNPPFALFFVKGKIKEIQALPLKKVSMYSPTLPCGITKCKTCEQINSACSISGPRGGFNLTSTGFNCDSKNVVYVVTCNKCNMLYVGQTGGTIRKRCNSHRTNIKSSVCQHKSICGSEFSIAGIFKVKQDEQDEDEQDEQDEDEQDEDEQDEDEQDEDEQDEHEQDEHEQDGQNEQDEQKLKNKNQRKAMETILILKLGTRQPNGLNKNISVKKK